MRLLVVEDDPAITEFVREGLELQRYQVEIAADGETAIQRGLGGGYDLIVLDVRLPLTGGIDVCRRLREQGVWTPILIVTALDSVQQRVAGLEAGADDYLCKPFALEELVARVRALLRRKVHPPTGPTLRIEDLTLDTITHEARRAGEAIALTPKEFALLGYLMERPGRVVTRAMIEEEVWGYEQDPLTNVVDVYISRLRQKVDQGHPKPLIETVRGVGYRLKP